MSGQEALQTIAAIAEWAADAPGTAPPDCADVIRRIDAMIGDTEVEALEDAQAFTLFREVRGLLQGRAS